MTLVHILGCGPAGLLAAHAVEQAGHEPTIISVRVKSQIGGAQFLHESIPGLTKGGEQEHVQFSKVGTKAEYARKVYGDPTHSCSWDRFKVGKLPAWSLRETYDRLWDKYKHIVRDVRLDGDKLRGLLRYPETKLVLSTVPLPLLCSRRPIHAFDSAPIFIVSGRPRHLNHTGNWILYSGWDQDRWFRASSLWGEEWTEYGGRGSTGLAKGREMLTGLKPTISNCNCLDHPKVVKLGRFGRWYPGVLTHHAYLGAADAVQRLS